jgi:hypothetical protein
MAIKVSLSVLELQNRFPGIVDPHNLHGIQQAVWARLNQPAPGPNLGVTNVDVEAINSGSALQFFLLPDTLNPIQVKQALR